MDNGCMPKSRSLSEPRSESKVTVGRKRGALEVQETSENSPKRVKMRDLESVLRSEAQAREEANNAAYLDVNFVSRELDLNVSIDPVNDTNGNEALVKELNKSPSSKIQEMECGDAFAKCRGLDLDLNFEDISSSINNHPYHSYKNSENLKSVDDSDCGSSIGSLDDKDSMKLWKEIKQNGYMSAPYGAVPMSILKPRGRNSKNDMMKKKIELAKKEQIDHFARVAAPSGLLHGLNPGIINHVRNKKQVHSIIEAIVKSERNENRLSGSDQCSRMKSGVKEYAERKNMENLSRGLIGHEAHHEGTFLGSMQMKGCPFFSGSMSLNSQVTRDGDSYMGGRTTSPRMHSKFKAENYDDVLLFRPLSSETVASDNNSSLTHDSANLSSVSSLSVKAANLASQWLELLNQDIKGRLAALRRSKKRVRAVIQIDLPFLMSKELSSDQETTKGDGGNAEAHRIRWSSLFVQMEKALSEEESHLESWLNQVKEMQSNCDKGLYKNSSYYAPQHSGLTRNESRLPVVDNSEKDLAVRAAAASIYSTCNSLLSMENRPCC